MPEEKESAQSVFITMYPNVVVLLLLMCTYVMHSPQLPAGTTYPEHLRRIL